MERTYIDLSNNKVINSTRPSEKSHLTNNEYVDSKTIISPSHCVKNASEYLMNDINEISIEYGWISVKLDNFSWSSHQNKKTLDCDYSNQGHTGKSFAN